MQAAGRVLLACRTWGSWCWASSRSRSRACTGGVLQMVNHGLVDRRAVPAGRDGLRANAHARARRRWAGLAGVDAVADSARSCSRCSRPSGLPGLNSFVGEFLAIVGTFAVSHVVRRRWPRSRSCSPRSTCLWSYQRMAYGPVREEHRHAARRESPRGGWSWRRCSRCCWSSASTRSSSPTRIDPATQAVIAHVVARSQPYRRRSPRCRRRRTERAVIARADARVRADPRPSCSSAGVAILAPARTRRSRPKAERPSAPGARVRRPDRGRRWRRSRSGTGTAPSTVMARDGRGRSVLGGLAAAAARDRRDRAAVYGTALLRARPAMRIAGSSTRSMLFATAGMTLIAAASRPDRGVPGARDPVAVALRPDRDHRAPEREARPR